MANKHTVEDTAQRLSAALIAAGLKEQTGLDAVVSSHVILLQELQAIAQEQGNPAETAREYFLRAVARERQYQEGVYGPAQDESRSGLEWTGILAKYVGKFATEAIARDAGHFQVLESELVKIAAVASAAYEALVGEKPSDGH